MHRRYWLLPSLLLLLSNCGHRHQYPKVIWTPGKPLQWLSYGLLAPGGMNADNVVANRWGFTYHTIAGCVVTEQLADSIKDHNQQVNNLLMGRYGKDWRKRYKTEVKQEHEAEQTALTLLKSYPEFAAKCKHLKGNGSGIIYHFDPVHPLHVYEIDITGADKFQGKETWVSYALYEVNLDQRIVKLSRHSIKSLEPHGL